MQGSRQRRVALSGDSYEIIVLICFLFVRLIRGAEQPRLACNATNFPVETSTPPYASGMFPALLLYHMPNQKKEHFTSEGGSFYRWTNDGPSA